MFHQLKTALISALVLHNADFTNSFSIDCDASKDGISAVFVQVHERDEAPIAFMSQKHNAAQRNYTATEQECLAARQVIRIFRTSVEGHEFEVATDHVSFKWLISQSDFSGRLSRWQLKLQGFKLTIKHRKGAQNDVPDALSRILDTNALGMSALSDQDSTELD